MGTLLQRWNRWRHSSARREAVAFYLLILPWLLGFVIFIAYPTLRSFELSLTHYQIGREPLFIGLDNYTRLTQDRNFWQALKVTTIYVFGSVPGSTVIAIVIAMLLAQKVRGVNFWRTIYFLPSVVAPVAVAILWGFVFNPQYGLINTLLRYVGIEGPGWITSEAWALPTVIFMSWWTVGGQIVIYLAGLKNIPQELYEVAEIDGAGPWAKFWNVTIPMLSPTIFFNVVLGFIGAFQIFEGPWVLTNGGPNDATLTYMIYLYRQAFQLGSLGYASALAWVLFMIIMILTVIIIRSSALWVYYEAARDKS
ncbi:MAG TPA: sugar ABC transporter permease [Aggregatilineales bacterium]|jgi:multiple sugar transport system permease protein|nr:sugar ABC transporter permease [Aggregatilineales bacterium]